MYEELELVLIRWANDIVFRITGAHGQGRLSVHITCFGSKYLLRWFPSV
jgi:hypothetical protein